MKYLKFLLIIGIITSTVSCKKNRYPEFENSANAQFTIVNPKPKPPATAIVASDYNNGLLSKATPAVTDDFVLKLVESGNVKSVSVLVDYRKTATVTTYTKEFKNISTWPQTYSASINDLVALFSSNGLTLANLAVGDRFVYRVVITLNSGTVISGQGALLTTAPYAITLTYVVTA
ncbi:hypothetical protein [Pedobacter hiemivivus]|uniref:Uncharacterized protein n=1 Tax=Pedobacter hiemivivus TaxID=2530454 RepID=A0A4R0N4V2_9SPHI|nr:hypothetical protein [Pedobacter hiemivivus]TCC94958.1 hypothetical protein EZ444_15725 [Pedobacter hiemivivus]